MIAINKDKTTIKLRTPLAIFCVFCRANQDNNKNVMIKIILLFRLLNYLRSIGRYSYFSQKQARPSSDLSIDEAYKILGLNRKKVHTKDGVIKAAILLQKKIHPDVGNPNSEYLSKLVNSSKDLILKTDFS